MTFETLMTIFDNFFYNFWQFWQIFGKHLRFAENFQIADFQIFWKFLWPETWHLRHWLHFWQLRTTIWTITLWPLNIEWWWQHSQFLRCFKYLSQIFPLIFSVDFWFKVTAHVYVISRMSMTGDVRRKLDKVTRKISGTVCAGEINLGFTIFAESYSEL